MSRVNIKASEGVHEELKVRKRENESFNDVLKRVLGLIPRNIDEITSFFPTAIKEAAEILEERFADDDRYEQVIIEHNEYHAVNFDSLTSNRTIIQLRFRDKGSQLNILYRGNHGELTTAATLDYEPDSDTLAFDVGYTRPDTGEVYETIGNWQNVEEQYVEGLEALQNAAYERWG
jgi:predicted CopG family antitoxin